MDQTVPRSLDSLPRLVALVREFLERERLGPHARGTGDVQVSLVHAPGEVHVQLRAAEPSPFDPTAAPRVNVNLPIEQRQPGGLGIHLVRELCREFKYEWFDSVGTTLVIMAVED